MKSVLTYVVLVVVACLLVPTAGAEMEQIPVVRLEQSIEIDAPPSAVWEYMVAGENLMSWCPYWKASDSNKAVTLTKVGDVLKFSDDWGNTGRSVVTYIDAGKELRVAHEPANGSYICQSKLILTPSESGTTVRYVEQYTDDQDAEAMKSTAETMQAAMETTLATIKAGVAG